MIKQSLTNSSILEKKFKILRTSIMLGNLRNRDELISDYEETAKEIDKIKKNVYEELLASKNYTTTTLEEEKNRLEDLINFIEGRVKERNDFVDDYIKITSNFLDGLDKVTDENELVNYKSRLSDINEYLSNCNEINELNEKLKRLRDQLEEKYDNKANNDIINSKLEDELIEEFNRIITKNEYYSSLNYPDIDMELDKLELSIVDKKGVLDTFTSSFEALTNAGISGAEREEYKSYVQDARLDYYSDIEKKSILNIYKLVLDKENDYDRLFDKRTNIDNVIKERVNTRKELEISSRDEFEYFIHLCEEQFNIIKSQKFNMENIDKLILEISDCEKRLEFLEDANNREAILDLLREFSEDAPRAEKIELPEEKESIDVIEEVHFDGPKAPNMVVKIKEPLKINVKTASDTAKLVMKKVVIVLEPKRFNTKKDKLKEAEEEIKIEREQTKLLDVEDIKQLNDEEKTDDNLLDFSKDHDEEEKDEFKFILSKQDDDDKNKVTFDFDPMTREFSNNLGIELKTQEADDKGVKEVKELDDVKINFLGDNDTVFPTEIFIQDPPVEKPKDLFAEVDPFLDDNQFETSRHEETAEEILSNMPSIDNIGTVKPNNTLSQIQNVANETDNIILPTMGLTDNEKANVPIVSENYIN